MPYYIFHFQNLQDSAVACILSWISNSNSQALKLQKDWIYFVLNIFNACNFKLTSFEKQAEEENFFTIKLKTNKIIYKLVNSRSLCTRTYLKNLEVEMYFAVFIEVIFFNIQLVKGKYKKRSGYIRISYFPFTNLVTSS